MRRIAVIVLLVSAAVMAERYALVTVNPMNQHDILMISEYGEIVHVYDDGSLDCVLNEYGYNERGPDGDDLTP